MTQHILTFSKNIFYSIFIISKLFFNSLSTIIAQSPSYIHYNTGDEFPSDLIHCGFQDKKGFLWFGTDKGLVNFDNKKIRVFSTREGLPDPEIFSIWEDRSNRLWLSCFRNKPCYRENGKLITWQQDKRLQKIDLGSGFCNFYEDSNGIIWCLAYNDAFYIEKDHVILAQFPDALFKIKEIDSQTLGFGMKSVISIKRNQYSNYIFKFDKNKVDKNSCVSIESSGNRILYSFKDRIYLLEYINESIVPVDSIENLSGILSTDRQGRFWLCSPAVGAICFNNNKRDLSNPVVYLPGKKAIYMFEDHQGTYWFCTMDEGVYALPKETPVIYSEGNGLPSNNIVSVSKGPPGTIYCGDDEGNMNIITDTGVETLYYPSIDGYNRILHVLTDSKGGKWVVADEGFYYESVRGRKKIDIKSTTPKVILEQQGKIWCGTSSFLFTISSKTREVTAIFANKRITALGRDSESTIWAGGIESVYCSSDSFRYNWGDAFPLLRSRIVAIHSGAPGEIWVITPESGLLKCAVQHGIITAVTAINGFLSEPIHNIQSMFREESGMLWLATNHGIYQLNPQNWKVTHIDHYDGLANNDVRSVVVVNDTLWAGTASGVTRLLLRRAPPSGDFPTYITGVHYQQQKTVQEIQVMDSIPRGREMLLPSDASLVEVEFTGLDYRSRGNLSYECLVTEKLLPFRWWTTSNLTNWFWSGFKGITDTTLVQRANLNFGVSWPPGRYTIDVTALTAGEVRSRRPDACTLVMRPDWYETLWCYIIIWGLVGSGFYRAYQTSVQLREMVTAVAKSRLFALQAQINPHFVGNAINAIQRFFYPPNPEGASVYTATLTRLLRRTLNFSEQTFITFREELQYDRDYLELTRLRLGDEKFRYEIHGATSIPEEMPFPALFLQPILENASIHGFSRSGVSVIEIFFSQRNGRLFCTITDNGPGMRPDSLETPKTDGEIRRSRGNLMLQQKAATLNQLYNLDLRLAFQSPGASGTQAIVSFQIDQVYKALNRQSLIDKNANASGSGTG